VLAVGFVLVFVFANYKDSVSSSIIASCKNIISVLLTVPGSFSDIMSYIRLWAMSVAGLSIAGTVNGFATPMFGEISLLLAGIILFACGHVFNMTLNGMSFLVHGVRLNTLEFSSHIGLEWSGFAYKPFAKRH
jgi:V/A-type H+-transporting ATPase subunit I